MSSSSSSFRFWDGNRIRKMPAGFKTTPKKISAARAGLFGGRPGSGSNLGFTKKSLTLLKPEKLWIISSTPQDAARAPLAGPAETGAGGVRRLLVSILLNGGFGYENLRLRSPLAVDDRLRPLF